MRCWLKTCFSNRDTGYGAEEAPNLEIRGPKGDPYTYIIISKKHHILLKSFASIVWVEVGIRGSRDEISTLVTISLVDVWTDSEHNREQKLELIPGHSLKVHRIVLRLNAEFLVLCFVRMHHPDGSTVLLLTRCHGKIHDFLLIFTLSISPPVMARNSPGVAVFHILTE